MVLVFVKVCWNLEENNNYLAQSMKEEHLIIGAFLKCDFFLALLKTPKRPIFIIDLFLLFIKLVWKGAALGIAIVFVGKNEKIVDMEKIKIQVAAIAHNQSQPNSFIVLLREEEGNRRLPIVIGAFEAQAIAIAAEGVKPNRPLTHDLLFKTLQQFNIILEEVIISALRDGVFYATLICQNPGGGVTKLDSRTSDALALALRFECPIFTYPIIMDSAGIEWNPPIEQKEDDQEKSISEFTDLELEEKLQKALEEEDYERAARLRDELKNRKS